MEVAYNHISKFFVQLNTVSQFLQKIFSKFFSTFYEYDGGYYLFITALLPFMLMFVVDILFSFIFSVRSREIRFFNVFSPKSWKSFNSQTYNRLPAERLKPSLLTLRYSRLSYFSTQQKIIRESVLWGADK